MLIDLRAFLRQKDALLVVTISRLFTCLQGEQKFAAAVFIVIDFRKFFSLRTAQLFTTCSETFC